MRSESFTLLNKTKLTDAFFSVMRQTYSEKENRSAPKESRACDLPITNSGALDLPLSYRRLVGAKTIKLL